jgi:DNA mismatch repair ATPase MutL
MNKQQLQQSLQQLRSELDRAQSLDAGARADLLKTMQDIETAIDDNDGLPADEQETLIDQLKESLWQFEKSHPTLTMIMGRVMDDLNRMGI